MADMTAPKTIILKNIIKVNDTNKVKWNTGLKSAAGEAATVADDTVMMPAISSNQVSVAIYGNKNEFVVLNAGEGTITKTTPEFVTDTYYKAASGGGSYEKIIEKPADWDEQPAGVSTKYFTDEGTTGVTFAKEEIQAEGESLKVTADNTEAVAFYLAQAKEDVLSVEVQ